MHFTDPGLAQILEDWLGHTDPKQRACGLNLKIDERLNGIRGNAFEAYAQDASTSETLWRRAVDYYEERVRVRPSETFSSLNSGAACGPLSPEQKLVRLERIDRVLDTIGVTLDQLQTAHAGSNASSRALIDSFLDQWNHRPDISRNPVSFAAFKDQLCEEIDDPDWPHLLRNRMGLDHYDTSGVEIRVALMEYSVADVTAANISGQDFYVPTTLDSEPYYQFVPTPTQLPFGCPMALSVIQSDDELIAELLHPRLNYARRHILKLGVINKPVSACDFIEMRNNHLWALRIAASRDDFGHEL